MDLSRRFAAGELSEVFGKVALDQDRQARLFRFRKLAQQVVQESTAEQRAIIEAYAKGVNAGLHGLAREFCPPNLLCSAALKTPWQ